MKAGILAVGRGNQVVEPVIGDDGNTLIHTVQCKFLIALHYNSELGYSLFQGLRSQLLLQK